MIKIISWVDRLGEIKIREDVRNVTVTCLVLFLTYLTFTPSLNLMPVSLGDSTNIDIMVVYYSRVIQYAVSIPICFFFPEIYKLLGLKLVYLLSAGLYIPFYFTMIWIKSEATLYIGAFFTGLANSMLWCAAPMCIADTSGPKKYQFYMGFCMCCLFIGVTVSGICNYYYLQGVYSITEEIRVALYSAFTGGAALAALIGVIGVKDMKGKRMESVQRAGKAEVQAELEDEKPGKMKNTLDVTIEGRMQYPGEGRRGTNEISRRFFFQLSWYSSAVQRKEFWLLVVPLFYWGVIWGYKSTIINAAIGFTFPDRKYIALKSIFVGGLYLVGALVWTPLSKLTSNFVSLSICTLMLIGACVLSILTFPKSAAVDKDPDLETYVTPQGYYIIIIACLLGAADSGFCLVFYSAVAKVFAANTTMGYATVQNWFNVFTIIALFAPKYINLHVYLYVTMAVVVASWLSLGIGLREYIRI